MINKSKLKQIEADNIEDAICVRTDCGLECGQKPLTATQLLSCIDEPAKQEDGTYLTTASNTGEMMYVSWQRIVDEIEAKVQRYEKALKEIADYT